MKLRKFAIRLPAFATALALLLPTTSYAETGEPNPLPEPLSESRTLTDEEQAVQSLLENYYAAFDSGDSLAMRLLVLDAKPFSQIESGSLDRSWRSYQENHLKPEMEASDKTQHTAGLVQLHTVNNDTAYAIYRLTLNPGMAETSNPSELLATAVLVKSANRWYLQHIHTSSQPQKTRNKRTNLQSPTDTGSKNQTADDAVRSPEP